MTDVIISRCTGTQHPGNLWDYTTSAQSGLGSGQDSSEFKTGNFKPPNQWHHICHKSQQITLIGEKQKGNIYDSTIWHGDHDNGQKHCAALESGAQVFLCLHEVIFVL